MSPCVRLDELSGGGTRPDQWNKGAVEEPVPYCSIPTRGRDGNNELPHTPAEIIEAGDSVRIAPRETSAEALRLRCLALTSVGVVAEFEDLLKPTLQHCRPCRRC